MSKNLKKLCRKKLSVWFKMKSCSNSEIKNELYLKFKSLSREIKLKIKKEKKEHEYKLAI